MPPRSRATLLGLPQELRDNIYAHLLRTDVDYKVAKEYDWRYGRHSFHAKPERPEGPLREYVVPWTSLALVCRSVNDELSNVLGSIADHSKSGCNDLTRWKLDVELPGRGVGAVTWRMLPCAPRNVRDLDVTINAVKGIRFWGDGGPMGSVSCLYQLLNAILHCGPHLRWTSPLPKHLHLNELRIFVEGSGPPKYMTWTNDNNGEPEAETVRHGDTFCGLRNLVGSLCGAGMLVGYVDVVRITDGIDELVETLDKESIVDDVKVVPSQWDGYGFEWGREG
ncbi:hypothetical protein LTR95_016918 [Oleoguttula sp. CCFEE 5521]